MNKSNIGFQAIKYVTVNNIMIASNINDITTEIVGNVIENELDNILLNPKSIANIRKRPCCFAIYEYF